MQNPVTGSGGMFIGTVAAFGSALKLKDLKIGDKIASLVSLSLTPLYIEEIMAIQQSISLEHNESMIGKELKVLIDRKEGGQYVGRSEYDSPEVDNEIWIDSKEYKLVPGQFALIKITGASDYDLTGIPIQ